MSVTVTMPLRKEDIRRTPEASTPKARVGLSPPP
jgi:hypothetical protein